jgi:hypothetical protein
METQKSKSSAANDSFYAKASETILNLATTDSQLLNFLKEYSNSDTSEANLQTINILMNQRNQRSQLISNLEDKRHNGAMAIISNTK